MMPEKTERTNLPALLAHFDEALKGGTPDSTGNEPTDSLAPVEHVELQRAKACLRLLEDVFPRSSTPRSVDAGAGPTVLGRFEIRRELGRGGFGIVYLAHDPHLGREVALKVPHAQALADAEVRARFQREAQSAAGLDHANLVSVYEAGEADQVTYIALAYCPGISLADWLRQRTEAVPLRHAASLVAALASAVHYAHERGIVHRDLKPANVLLQMAEVTKFKDQSDLTSLVPKIADFGLAKDLDDRAPQTTAGTIAGTPCYMAPEQASARGGAVSPAIDVYALGAILYELMTGRAPFQGESVLDTLDQVRYVDPVPPRRLRSGLSRDLETICLKCLEKEPGKRYVSARGLAEDLERFLAGKPIIARPVGVVGRLSRWCRRKPAVAGLAAALVLVFVGGFGGMVWQWQRAEASAAEAIAKAGDLKREGDKVVEQWERAERHLTRAQSMVDRMTRLAFSLADQPGHDQTGRALLQEALVFHREVMQEKSNDPAVRLETARAYGRVGDIHHILREWNKAEDALHAKIAILDVLHAEFPDDVPYRIGLAHAHRSLAHVLRDQKKTQEARKAYDKAIALEEKLLHDNPKNARMRIALANSFLNSVPVLPAGEAAEIERRRLRVVQLQNEAVEMFPEDRNFRQELALGLAGIASLHFEHGQHALAEDAARQAVELCQKLHQEDPKERWFDRYLANSHRKLAHVLTVTKPAQAEAEYNNAIRLLAKVHVDFPLRPIYRVELADTYVDVCRLLTAPNRLADVERMLGEANRHYDKLAHDYAAEPEHLRKQTVAALLLGQRLRANKKYAKAQDAFRKMLAANDRLVARFNSPGDRYNRAWDYCLLSDVHELDAKSKEAEMLMRQSVNGFRQLADEFPNAAYRRALASRGNELTRLLRNAGKLKDALEVSRSAAAEWQKLHDTFRDDPGHRRGLADSLIQYAGLLQADHQFAEAATAYRAAVQAIPNDADSLLSLASFLLTCPDAKIQAPAEARDLAQRANKLAPKNATIWNTLGTAYFRTGDYRNAATALEQAAHLDETRADWFFLGMAYWQLGDTKAASRLLKDKSSAPGK